MKITKVQKVEIDKRLADIENGKTKFYPFEEVKKIVRENFKRELKGGVLKKFEFN